MGFKQSIRRPGRTAGATPTALIVVGSFALRPVFQRLHGTVLVSPMDRLGGTTTAAPKNTANETNGDLCIAAFHGCRRPSAGLSGKLEPI